MLLKLSILTFMNLESIHRVTISSDRSDKTV